MHHTAIDGSHLGMAEGVQLHTAEGVQLYTAGSVELPALRTNISTWLTVDAATAAPNAMQCSKPYVVSTRSSTEESYSPYKRFFSKLTVIIGRMRLSDISRSRGLNCSMLSVMLCYLCINIVAV